MSERERLEQERAELEEQLIEARTEVDRLERERARVHDAIGALIGAPVTSCARCYFGGPCLEHGLDPARVTPTVSPYHVTGVQPVDAAHDCQNPGTCGVCHQCQRPQPCPVHAPAGRDTCPDAQLPDGPTCPRCGGPRAPSGVGGGSWVHFPAPESSL
jgi:hypothetical protein